MWEPSTIPTFFPLVDDLQSVFRSKMATPKHETHRPLPLASPSFANPQPSMTVQPIATAAVLLETSVGSIVVDLFGADMPSLTANFANLCRANILHGMVATEVIPDVAMFFSHAADPVLDQLVGETQRSSLTDLECSAPSLDPAVLTNSFWHLVGPQYHAKVVHQQQAATAEANLARRGRRLVKGQGTTGSVHLQYTTTGTSGGGRAAGSLGYRGLLIVEPTGTAGVLKDATAGSPSPLTLSSSLVRFGITLSDRSMDFLEGQYLAIGAVREGLPTLRVMRQAPFREVPPPSQGGPPSTYVRGSPQWPQPLRMLRVKRATVLPTGGTEGFLPPCTESVPRESTGGSTLGDMLRSTGCFDYWAPLSVVQHAAERFAELVGRSMSAYGYRHPLYDAPSPVQAGSASAPVASSAAPWQLGQPQPLVVLSHQTPGTTTRSNHSCLVEYNAHYTGNYLSSDEDGCGEDTAGGAAPLSRAEREARHESTRQLHQEKANETLSLMLNLLNGVADVDGSLKPPENVLFVCKLNPATTGEGLALCFQQFGTVQSAEVVVDRNTKESLCYGFVEFASVESCYRAFTKMDAALIDDCRIHVDFSQSVSKLWFAKKSAMRKRSRCE